MQKSKIKTDFQSLHFIDRLEASRVFLSFCFHFQEGGHNGLVTHVSMDGTSLSQTPDPCFNLVYNRGVVEKFGQPGFKAQAVNDVGAQKDEATVEFMVLPIVTQ